MQGAGWIVRTVFGRYTIHALDSIASRGITPKMIDVVTKYGSKYWNPFKGTLVYFLRIAGTRYMVAQNLWTLRIITTYEMSKIPGHYIRW